MGVIVITFFVKAANADTPAPVLVPADGFYIAGFYGGNRCADLSHHIVSKVRAVVAVGSGNTEIVVICIRESLCNRRKSF